MKAEDFDKKFDDGKEDIIDALDQEAALVGVTRQSIIKVWLVERLKAEARDR